MGVHKRNGIVYLDVHKLPEKAQSELDRRRYKSTISPFFGYIILEFSLSYFATWSFCFWFSGGCSLAN